MIAARLFKIMGSIVLSLCEIRCFFDVSMVYFNAKKAGHAQQSRSKAMEIGDLRLEMARMKD